ncbi:hypothetical protein [Sphingobacterium daejeonense]|uniref:hypothetical protein n=1 Tax=Sphingobacterium daejeonense TaxID=371142 RepID=UPI0010C4644E|nr:hypothetical protein [Sphingobacterium daejeonense]VTQ06929.1 Galactokinase [Sphingobacterium daejeonense]
MLKGSLWWRKTKDLPRLVRLWIEVISKKWARQMFRAHEGLSKEYEVSCDELDFLVENAKKFPEVLGARMMGGGFGGCTINIVKKGFGQQLVDSISPVYKKEFNLELTPIFVKTDNGSELVY